MSKLGTEAELLARLMEQARKAKMAGGGDREVVVSQAPGEGADPIPVDSDEEVTLQTRLRQKKRKAPASSSAGAAGVISALPLRDVVTTTGLTVGEHVPAPSKKTKVVTAESRDARASKVAAVAKEAQLEDEGFIRHVAERLRSAGLDRLVQGQGSPRENRARAFDSILRGLHNLYLVDSMEEDVRLKEQVANLEAGLLVEQTERKNITRQRDNFKAKLERVVEEKAGALTRVATLEEENARLKAKVAELPQVVAQERKGAAEDAVSAFKSSIELTVIREEEYRRGYDAGYEKHFNTLIEKDWINVDKYFADMEAAAQLQRDLGTSTKGGGPEVGAVPEAETAVTDEVIAGERTPEPMKLSSEGLDLSQLKPNGDPLTPGITPASGPVVD